MPEHLSLRIKTPPPDDDMKDIDEPGIFRTIRKMFLSCIRWS